MNTINEIMKYITIAIGNHPLKNQKDIALELGISEKTLCSYLNYQNERNPIPLQRFLEICDSLGLSTAQIFSDQLETIDRFNDPPKMEKLLLELESKIPVGSMKMVVSPFLSSPLQLDPLFEIYAKHGFYRRFRDFHLEIDGTPTSEKIMNFYENRKKRRKLFRYGQYIINIIIMRDEFENWINGRRMFKHLAIDNNDKRFSLEESEKWKNRVYALIDQIDYLIELLDLKYDDIPRLNIRMTRHWLRIQYGIFEHPNKNQVLISANQGFLLMKHAKMETFFQHEFAKLWENEHSNDEYMSLLITNEAWVKFLTIIRSRLQACLDENREPKGTWDKECGEYTEFFNAKKILKEMKPDIIGKS